MAVQAQYLAYILEQLAMLPAVRPNRMFGGVGLYSEGLFFGLIDDDTLFFKTDESNIASYRERNMPRFMPFKDRPETELGYHQVPADVIEDQELLVEWARRSVAVQRSLQVARSSKARRPARPKTRKPAPMKKVRQRKNVKQGKKAKSANRKAARRAK